MTLPPNTSAVLSATRPLLVQVAQDVSVAAFMSYRDYLDGLYIEVKNRAGNYSYLQLAEDLGFSKSNVIWLVIAGRRKLTMNTTQRIIDNLNLKGSERRYFQALVAYNNASRPDKREEYLSDLLIIKREQLPPGAVQENLEYYSEWFYPVIREMTALAEFSSNPEWIAERLSMKILPRQVEKALKLLEDLGLIRYDTRKKRHISTGEPIRPDRSVSGLAATAFHQKMCEIAAEALTRVPSAEREYNTITFCASKEEAMEISALIYELCEKIVRIEQKSTKKNQVFQVNLQLFPLTKK